MSVAAFLPNAEQQIDFARRIGEAWIAIEADERGHMMAFQLLGELEHWASDVTDEIARLRQAYAERDWASTEARLAGMQDMLRLAQDWYTHTRIAV